MCGLSCEPKTSARPPPRLCLPAPFPDYPYIYTADLDRICRLVGPARLSTQPLITMPPAPLVQKPQASRYRRGKLPQGAPAPSDSDESSGEEEDDDDAPPKPKFRQPARAPVDENVVAGGAGRVIQTGAAGKGRNIQVALRDVKVDEEGLLIGGKREVGRTVEEGECNSCF